jgi:putative oxidoreductase
VQKASVKTIIVKLNVQDVTDIQTVGIRGNDKPLSWDYDLKLTPIVKDTLYTATFSTITGYKFTEAKFTVNGAFELIDQENRRIVFSEGDTTVYEAKFNTLK